jgi:hypothetical protein
MPGATARRLWPKGIFVRPRMDHYREESRQSTQIVGETGAVFEQMSIDEAYLDLSALCQAEDQDAALLKTLPLARNLKQRIRSERQLTATIRVASNRLLSKIASDHQKPDGLTLIPETEKVQFLLRATAAGRGSIFGSGSPRPSLSAWREIAPGYGLSRSDSREGRRGEQPQSQRRLPRTCCLESADLAHHETLNSSWKPCRFLKPYPNPLDTLLAVG